MRRFSRGLRCGSGAHLDSEAPVRSRNLELDDLGTEVVAMAVEPNLWVHAHVELVAALASVIRGLDAQRVEVVNDFDLVGVLGQVTDREVHLADDDGRYRCTAAAAAGAKKRSSMSRSTRASSSCARSSPSPSGPPPSGVRRWNSKSAIRRPSRSTGGEERGWASAAWSAACSASTEAATEPG